MTREMNYLGQGPEGTQAWELLTLWGWGCAALQHIDVFTNPEAPWTHTIGIFIKAFAWRHDQLSNPSLLSEEWGIGLKIPSF